MISNNMIPMQTMTLDINEHIDTKRLFYKIYNIKPIINTETKKK